MPYTIRDATFVEFLNGRAIVRADSQYLSIDRFGEEETFITFDRPTAEKLIAAISVWLDQTNG